MSKRKDPRHAAARREAGRAVSRFKPATHQDRKRAAAKAACRISKIKARHRAGLDRFVRGRQPDGMFVARVAAMNAWYHD
ncbi:MAG: hypothetical protein ACFB3T_00145 [Geminicoccaceae bacterium]